MKYWWIKVLTVLEWMLSPVFLNAILAILLINLSMKQLPKFMLMALAYRFLNEMNVATFQNTT